eukprot:TRINITY_DN4014_c0_g1_i1.p1 TRINITY_DN4014_c0_g1~~TRINITY_DN4014_c0_g1_i1.p1  ORF type:complete len:1460 (-),score=547.03 TRINITY_DN4014_c0_g1_i1:140-4366(-)
MSGRTSPSGLSSRMSVGALETPFSRQDDVSPLRMRPHVGASGVSESRMPPWESMIEENRHIYEQRLMSMASEMTLLVDKVASDPALQLMQQEEASAVHAKDRCLEIIQETLSSEQEQKIAELSRELSETRAELSALQPHVAQVEEALRSSRSECQSIRDECEDLRRSSRELHNYQRENEKIRKRLAKTEEQLRLSTSSSAAMREIEGAQLELQKTKRRASKYHSSVDELKKEKKALKEKMVKLEDEMHRMDGARTRVHDLLLQAGQKTETAMSSIVSRHHHHQYQYQYQYQHPRHFGGSSSLASGSDDSSAIVSSTFIDGVVTMMDHLFGTNGAILQAICELHDNLSTDDIARIQRRMFEIFHMAEQEGKRFSNEITTMEEQNRLQKKEIRELREQVGMAEDLTKKIQQKLARHREMHAADTSKVSALERELEGCHAQIKRFEMREADSQERSRYGGGGLSSANPSGAGSESVIIMDKMMSLMEKTMQEKETQSFRDVLLAQMRGGFPMTTTSDKKQEEEMISLSDHQRKTRKLEEEHREEMENQEKKWKALFERRWNEWEVEKEFEVRSVIESAEKNQRDMESQISRLENVNQELSSEKNDFAKRLDKSSEEIISMQSELDRHKRHIADLEAAVRNSKSLLEREEEQRKAAEKEMRSTSVRFEEAQKMWEEANTQAEKEIDELRKYKEEIERIVEERHDSMEDIASLSPSSSLSPPLPSSSPHPPTRTSGKLHTSVSRNASSSMLLQSQSVGPASIRHRMQFLEETNRTLAQQAQKSEEKCLGLEKTVRELREQNERQRLQAATLSETYRSDSQESHRKLQEELEKQQKMYEKELERANDAVRGVKRRWEMFAWEKKKKLHALETSIRETLLQSTQTISSVRMNVERDLHQMRQYMEDSIICIAQKCQAMMRNERKQYDKELVGIEHQQEESLSIQSREYDRLLSEKEARAKKEIDNLKRSYDEKLQQSRSEASKLSGKLAMLSTQLEEMRTEIGHYEIELRETSTQKQMLHEELMQLREERRVEQEKLQTKDREMLRIERKASELDQTQKALESRVSEIQRLLSSIQSVVPIPADVLDGIMRGKAKTFDSHLDRLQNVIKTRIEEKVQNAKEPLIKTVREREREGERLKGQIEALADERESLLRTMNQLKKDLEEERSLYSQSHLRMQEEFEKSQTEFSSTRQRVAEESVEPYRRELKQLESEVERLQEEFRKEFERREEEMEKQRRQIEKKFKEEARSKEEEWKSREMKLREHHESEMARQREVETELRRQVSQLEKEFEVRRSEMEEVSRRSRAKLEEDGKLLQNLRSRLAEKELQLEKEESRRKKILKRMGSRDFEASGLEKLLQRSLHRMSSSSSDIMDDTAELRSAKGSAAKELHSSTIEDSRRRSKESDGDHLLRRSTMF